MIIFEREYPTGIKLKEAIISAIAGEIYEIEMPITVSEPELQLLLDEALVNAMEHGNKWDPRKKVKIRIITRCRSIQIEISDEGQGFNYKSRVSELRNSPPLRERGRGLQMMRGLCQTEWIAKNNTLKLNIPVELSC